MSRRSKIAGGILLCLLAGAATGWHGHWQIKRQRLSHDEAVRRASIGM